eukprot:scaffold715_cov217-Chaetoceros_neogracile.AAC.5
MTSSCSRNVLYYVNPKSTPVPLTHVYHATASRFLSTSLPTTPSTTTTDVDSAYCPQCLTSWDGASAFSAAKGRCVKSNPNPASGGREVLVGCMDCPECEAVLTLGVLEKKCCFSIEAKVPEDHSHICVYKCGYCHWDSVECGIYHSFGVLASGDGKESSSHDVAVKSATEELQLKMTDALQETDESDLFQKLQSCWISKSNEVDRNKRRADLLRKGSNRGNSGIQSGTESNHSGTHSFVANDLDTYDEDEKKIGSELWSVESLEEAVKRRKERMAKQVVQSIPVQAFHNNTTVMKVTDDVLVNEKDDAGIVNMSPRKNIRQQLISGRTKTLDQLSVTHLPVPVALRVRAVRRCLKELDAGRPGILIKPKVNPLEGDTSLRYGHGQWWKKDSSAIHSIPRVQIKAEKYNSSSNQYAILLHIKNPTLGPVTLRLCRTFDENAEFDDSSEVILDPMTLQKATVNIIKETQQFDERVAMKQVTLEAVEDSFLDIGKGAANSFSVDDWREGDLDLSLKESFQVLSVTNDVAWIQYVTESVESQDGQESNEECRYLGTPLSLEIEISDESWESSLIQAQEMEGDEKDFVTFTILPVWRDHSSRDVENS